MHGEDLRGVFGFPVTPLKSDYSLDLDALAQNVDAMAAHRFGAWFGGLGDDTVPGYFAVGVQAYTSSISNIAPKLSLALADAGLRRDFHQLNKLMERYVNPLYALRERSSGYEVVVIKAAMEMLGMRAGPVRPPLMSCREKIWPISRS